jgi:tetratricopeptide (TPR) repeat protein
MRIILISALCAYCSFGVDATNALAAPQKSAGKLVAAADLYKRAGEDSKALKCISEAIDIHPGATEYFMRGDIELNLNRLDEALVDAKKALALEPNNPECIRLAGRVYLQQKDFANAMKEFNLCVKLSPNFLYSYSDRARLFELRKEFGKAAADYTISMKDPRQKTNFRLFTSRGKCYMQTKEYEKALADFSSAINIMHDLSQLYRLRAEAYAQLGKADLALKDKKTAISLDDDWKLPKEVELK